jgi:hypothetical protein
MYVEKLDMLQPDDENLKSSNVLKKTPVQAGIICFKMKNDVEIIPKTLNSYHF